MNASDAAYVYDGHFDAFLCVVVEAFRRGEIPKSVGAQTPELGLFGEVVRVDTDAGVAARAARRVDRLTEGGLERLYHAFLSEAPGVEVALVRVLAEVVARGAGALEDLRFPLALAVERWAGRVGREVHRMHAFVRFEQREGGWWVARVRPDGHVLPLVGPHFEARYPAMRWAIVDARRGLALVHIPAAERAGGEEATRIVPAEAVEAAPQSDDEAHVQQMWRTYFHAVTIPERKNLRLHLRHVPRRYWPYLVEKRAEGAVKAVSS